jgi:hypothetical protein
MRMLIRKKSKNVGNKKINREYILIVKDVSKIDTREILDSFNSDLQ